MIIDDHEKLDVEVHGAQDIQSFTIKASAKAFQILSSNLYSNPMGSMIRELSTNAYDAHIMVGEKTKPFIIKVPNSLDPTFKIRDFGPGLSEKEIHSVYTTFFESTKTNSNDVVGCLGLGSKSPFGVADSFTITSFFNGTKTIYSAFLNDMRIPSIAKFHTEETTEENGIELEIAIKKSDIGQFSRELNTQLRYFTTKPIIEGDSNFEWSMQEEYLYSGKGWRMIEGRYGNARVLQGQIAYPINTDDMGTKYYESSDIIKTVLQMNVIFDVNIGDVNIAPSREALSYDAATVDNILKYTQNIVEQLPEMIVKAVEDCETEWDARIKYNVIIYDLGGVHSQMNRHLSSSGKILWNGIDISDTTLYLPKDDIGEYRYFDKSYSNKFRKNNQTPSQNWQKRDDEDFYWHFHIKSLEQMKIFYAVETDKQIDARVKQYMNDQDFGHRVEAHIIKTDKPLKHIKSKLGTDSIIEVSGLEKIRRQTRKKGTTVKLQTTVQQYSHYGYNKSEMWDTYTFDDSLDTLEGYYLELDRFDVIYDSKKYSEIKDYIKGALELDIIKNDDLDKIYGLRKTNMKKPHKLKCLFTYLKTQFKATKQHFKYDFGDIHDVQDKLSRDSSLLTFLESELPKTSLIYPLITASIENKDKELTYYQTKLIDGLDIKIPSDDLSTISKEADKRYYMINAAGYYISHSVALQYIKEMDEFYQKS